MTITTKYEIGQRVWEVHLREFSPKEFWGVGSTPYPVSGVFYRGSDKPITYLICESSAREDNLFPTEAEAQQECDRRNGKPAKVGYDV